jgi:hypothetical protein
MVETTPFSSDPAGSERSERRGSRLFAARSAQAPYSGIPYTGAVRLLLESNSSLKIDSPP